MIYPFIPLRGKILGCNFLLTYISGGFNGYFILLFHGMTRFRISFPLININEGFEGNFITLFKGSRFKLLKKIFLNDLLLKIF